MNRSSGTILEKIRKHPRIYSFLQRIYYSTRMVRIKQIFIGTSAWENEWENRHKKERSDWIKGYEKSLKHPHRKILIDGISKLKPGSVLEIGCNCGPNLSLLRKKYPKVKLTGIDINPEAIQHGRNLFREDKNTDLIVGKADVMKRFEDNSFDVVFSDAVLIYIGPDKIDSILCEMLRISKKGIVLLEWQDSNIGPKGEQHNNLWVRDYRKLFKKYKREVIIQKIKDDDWPDMNWQRFGAIITTR
ncbi:class I SAM-dependent methyltransferase [Candidatus Woesearchaeota archaeon]|nr:class I SAM-dependent methyltransferase [Candidatus Woesearchaeota archaeon]